MQTRQNRIECFEVLSSRSRFVDSNAAMMSPVDMLDHLEDWPSHNGQDSWWPPSYDEFYSDDDELNLRRLSRGANLLSMFITCFYWVMILRRSMWYRGCAVLMYFFYCSLRCAFRTDFALNAKCSSEPYRCWAHQSWRVMKIRWVIPSTHKALREFSS